jgi:hypothetical protein
MTAPQKQQIFPASRIRVVEDRSPPILTAGEDKAKRIHKFYTTHNK